MLIYSIVIMPYHFICLSLEHQAPFLLSCISVQLYCTVFHLLQLMTNNKCVLFFSFILLIHEYSGSSWKVDRVLVPLGRIWWTSTDVCVVFGRSAWVRVSWAFVHPVGTHVEDTWKRRIRSLRREYKHENEARLCVCISLCVRMHTWEECEHHCHPAHYIGPGESPAAIAFTVVVHCHSCVDSHGQQHKEGYRGDTIMRFSW